MSVQNTIKTKLSPLGAEVLVVTNESNNHSVPEGSESHFRVLVVTDQFEAKSRLARHRTINKLLAQELAGPIHALAIEALTPEEWSIKGAQATSPDCLGGSKAEAQS